MILERDAVGRSNHENDERRREGTRSACDQPEKENPLLAATSSVRISIRSLTDGVDKIPSVAMGVAGSKDKLLSADDIVEETIIERDKRHGDDCHTV